MKIIENFSVENCVRSELTETRLRGKENEKIERKRFAFDGTMVQMVLGFVMTNEKKLQAQGTNQKGTRKVKKPETSHIF